MQCLPVPATPRRGKADSTNTAEGSTPQHQSCTMESSVVFASTHLPKERHIVQTPLGFHGTTTKGVYTTIGSMCAMSQRQVEGAPTDTNLKGWSRSWKWGLGWTLKKSQMSNFSYFRVFSGGFWIVMSEFRVKKIFNLFLALVKASWSVWKSENPDFRIWMNRDRLEKKNKEKKFSNHTAFRC